MEPPVNQGAGASNQGGSLAEQRSQKQTSEGHEGTRIGCHEGVQHLRFVSHADCWFQQTPAGYLVNVTHKFGGPADNDLESDPE